MGLLQDLFVNHPFWAWIALAAALLAVEVLSGSGWLLWPAASAGATALLAGFAGVRTAEAFAVFAGLTIVSTFVGRRYLARGLGGQGHDINDNIARLVGHEGRAVAAFHDRRGRVFIDGKEWAAELADGDAPEADARVVVVGVQGARLKVRGA